MSRIFINYRRQDSEGHVGRLYDRLCEHFPADHIFMDIAAIRPGADFVQILEDAVSQCDVFLAVIGPQWLDARNEDGSKRLDDERDFVRVEIISALKHGKIVIPTLVGRAKMPSSRDLPEEMRPITRRNAYELTHQRFAYDVEKLAETIKTSSSTPKTSGKPRASSETLRTKMRAIKALKDRLFADVNAPLYAHRTENRYFPVLGDGNPDANILFLGQAPGEYEAIQGRTFVGASGDVLDEMLLSIGLRRDDIYLTNLVLDRPPDNRDPNADEIAYYAPYIDQLIEIIQPSVIVTLGRFAMSHILRKYGMAEQKLKISQIHGQYLQAKTPHGALTILPLYHPAVVLYSSSERETLRRDFQQLKAFV